MKYILMFDQNKKANYITPVDDTITKDQIYIFDKLPDHEYREGYANSLYLNDQGELEWHWDKVPEVAPMTEEQIEELASYRSDYRMGYDRAVLDAIEENNN